MCILFSACIRWFIGGSQASLNGTAVSVDEKNLWDLLTLSPFARICADLDGLSEQV